MTLEAQELYLSEKDFEIVRRTHGLTVSEMAARLGITPAYVHMIEKGKANFSDKVQTKLIEKFDLTDAKLAKAREFYQLFMTAK